jgi:hypothetical protein
MNDIFLILHTIEIGLLFIIIDWIRKNEDK